VIGSLGGLLLVALATLGSGAMALTGLGVLQTQPRAEQAAWSFAAGLGLFGWLLFFPGLWGAISPHALIVYCCLLACGAVLLARPGPARSPPKPLRPIEWVLLACIACALLLDLAEGLSPPADADTLAYHFALPKQFLAAGHIEFVPRAGDGAIPMLVHMSYLAALGIGGERTLTLWAMLSGWAAAGFLYVVCRRHLDRGWSLTAAAVLLTVPAIIYGGGSGQVEARLALFAFGGAMAAAEALRTGQVRYAVLAGLLAGFFAAGKLTGLLFLPALGCVFLLNRRWLALGAAFSGAAVIAGAQWYVWNWVNTGDPVFPVLFRMLGLPDSEIWTRAHDAFYRAFYFQAENPIPHTVWNWIAYPFIATFGLVPEIEGGRTGLGPFFVLLAPFALAAAWQWRRKIGNSRVAIPALATVLFYSIWFFSGTSQRTRHLVPVLPIAIMCVTAASARLVQYSAAYRTPIAAAVAGTLAMQLAGHATFAAPYVSHVVAGDSRETFLEHAVTGYAPVRWINANLTAKDKVFVDQRQLIYLSDVPVFYGHYLAQTLIDISPAADDPALLWRQLRNQGVTHLLIAGPPPETEAVPAELTRSLPLHGQLYRAACIHAVQTIAAETFKSRTRAFLITAPDQSSDFHVARLDPENCRFQVLP
jgi:4-amino-4-deoxy-L-arabinose transferase-like glycosyltransferase